MRLAFQPIARNPEANWGDWNNHYTCVCVIAPIHEKYQSPIVINTTNEWRLAFLYTYIHIYIHLQDKSLIMCRRCDQQYVGKSEQQQQYWNSISWTSVMACIGLTLLLWMLHESLVLLSHLSSSFAAPSLFHAPLLVWLLFPESGLGLAGASQIAAYLVVSGQSSRELSSPVRPHKHNVLRGSTGLLWMHWLTRLPLAIVDWNLSFKYCVPALDKMWFENLSFMALHFF